MGVVSETDMQIRIRNVLVDFSILPKKLPNAPKHLKREEAFHLPEGVDPEKLHMIRIRDIYGTDKIAERKLFISMIVNKMLSPIKSLFNMILGLLPPAITMIIKSPILMGSLMFYFVWYCIERIFLFKSIANFLDTQQRIKNIEKVVAKPALEKEIEVNKELSKLQALKSELDAIYQSNSLLIKNMIESVEQAEEELGLQESDFIEKMNRLKQVAMKRFKD